MKLREKAYKDYVKARKHADKLKERVRSHEVKCISHQRIYHPEFTLYFPVNINFSGMED
jgi:hypothetical protein